MLFDVHLCAIWTTVRFEATADMSVAVNVGAEAVSKKNSGMECSTVQFLRASCSNSGVLYITQRYERIPPFLALEFMFPHSVCISRIVLDWNVQCPTEHNALLSKNLSPSHLFYEDCNQMRLEKIIFHEHCQCSFAGRVTLQIKDT